MGFLFRILVNAFAIYLVAEIVPGITVASVPAALGAGLVLGLINAVVRPILVVLTLPVTLLTLGLFLLVLNAFCLWLTSLLVKSCSAGWPAHAGAASTAPSQRAATAATLRRVGTSFARSG